MSRTTTLALLLFGVAWFTAAATAVRSASRIWLRHWAERRLRGSGGGQRIETLIERPQRLLVTAGVTVAVLMFSAGLVLAAAPLTRTALFTQGVVLVVTFLVFGQLIPRAIGRRWATALIPVLALPLRLLDFAVWPLSELVRRLVRSQSSSTTAEEDDHADLEELLREGELEGVGEPEEIELITGVMQFGGKAVRDVMTPRASVFAVDSALDKGTIVRQVAQSNYSRVPAYAGTLDSLRGMIHAFDIFETGTASVPPLRPILDTRADQRCDELLYQMLRQRIHFAAVRAPDGALAGIVTLEDLLEELVGDIRDEHDEPAAEAPVERAS